MLDRTALTGFGPFFAASTYARPPASPWRSMAELVDGGPALGARIEQVRTALAVSTTGGTVAARVAASVAQLGLTARIVAPLLALAVLGREPAVDLAELHWQPELGGPFSLSLPERLTFAGAPNAPASTLHACLEGPVSALVTATLREVPVAPAVLWGNVASTVHSAGQLIGAARPDLAAPTAAVTGAALAHPLLSGTHGRSQGRFRRRNCCLIYSVRDVGRPLGVCGDCVLPAA